MQRSSAVRLQRCGHSEVAVISDTVWAQCRGLQYAGSARTIPNKLAQEMQYAAHIGVPSGLFFSLLGFGMYTLFTGIGSKVLALSASLRRVRFPSKSPRKFGLVI